MPLYGLGAADDVVVNMPCTSPAGGLNRRNEVAPNRPCPRRLRGEHDGGLGLAEGAITRAISTPRRTPDASRRRRVRRW